MARRIPNIDTPAVIARPGQVVDICAGPGGWDMGGRIIGLPGMVGLDADEGACATARAAGFVRVHGDMRKVAPKRHRGVIGAVISPPCPAWSKSGLRAGIRDMQIVLDAFTCLGVGCGCEWPDLINQVEDPRAVLAVEVARWALLAPNLTWLAAELTEAAEPLWEDLTAEIYAAGWEWCDVYRLDATDYGIPARRPRVFLIARRYTPPTVRITPATPLPTVSMAAALGWEPGVRVWTRNNRRATGGNAFSADGPSWCLTGSTRSWKIGDPTTGHYLTTAQAGLLNGFPLDYPWTAASRTAEFLQVADVVAPTVGAAVLGVATNTPWEAPVRAYLADLYGHAQQAPPVPQVTIPAPRRTVDQLALF
jgi:DNA (cytosine-5)-methyltransferase 1